MQAGDLNTKITIQGDTSDGTTPPVYADLFADIWANKKAFKGTSFYGAAADQEATNIIYTIRYTTARASGIKATMRIIDGDGTLEIKVPPVDAENTKQWLVIYAVGVLQNGG